MPGFEKTSEQASAATIVAGDEFLGVQSSTTVLATAAQIKTFIDGTGIANTVTITGEHMFTEDNELDYSGSIINGMAPATITFTPLPADTVTILVDLQIAHSGQTPNFEWKRTSGGTKVFSVLGQWADGGINGLYGQYWMPTGGNSMYIVTATMDATSNFVIIGYKTGA